ncbi:MAG: hypothetical protein M1830_000047 [Pleopsidium flavum]|nr:MAG: hypothetical protein M1830_000047 [Pleopsidium flavum]
MTEPAEEQPTDARARLLSVFSTPASEHGKGWSKLWDEGDFLPWDKGTPNPALVDILTDRHDLIGPPTIEEGGSTRRKRALVPGCGRGYDVLLLASFGYDAYGLEISESAVKKCEEEKSGNGVNYKVHDEKNGAGETKFIVGDFFTDDWFKEVRGARKFELIYDYTFLCALPPSMRPAWSLRYSQLLAASPAGNLICLEFPTYKPPSTGGPPFGLTSKVYVEHLSHPGEDLPYDGEGNIKADILRRASKGGLERVAHWQPKRTHEIGKGTDWVSIWRLR